MTIPRRDLCLILILLTIGACAPRPSAPPLTPTDIIKINVGNKGGEYRLGPGDKISIRFYYNPALDDEVVVRPDGKVSLQLVDEVSVSGLTIQELDKKLTHAYAKALLTSPEKYTLGIGDTIAIKSYYAEKLNDEVKIRPDGKISLILIGEVDAAGKTPRQVQDILNQKYAAFLDHPDVSVIVRDFHPPNVSVTLRESVSQRIYVGGEVRNPMVMPLRGKMRLLDALIMAGGALDSGDQQSVFVLRNTGDDKGNLFIVNAHDVLKGTSDDIVLAPYDVIYVPKTSIANATTFLRQIYRLIPDQVMVTFPIYLNTQDVNNHTKF